ncbi:MULTISPECIES: SdpI family protein [Paenibacillus]|uniref:SdpI family protein n=1 Tax=Paenibacillus TaxID=44249 RepID=UPI0022B85B06|nr:SdpI family protein [Paenibacillus caseinilyticus]MCZ8522289.1 SdpI family protein [Paenibacillus caseinilyticus]
MKRYLPSLILLTMAVVLSLLAYPYMPEQMAVHFSLDGTPDRYTGKAWALATAPFFMLLLMGAALFIPFSPSDARTLSARTLILGSSAALLFGVHMAILLYGLGYEFNIGKYIAILMGTLFLVVGNYMPRFQPNRHVGIRTPWTLSSEENWRRTHRTAAKVWFIGGLLMLACPFLPAGLFAGVFLAILALVLILTIGISYYYARART